MADSVTGIIRMSGDFVIRPNDTTAYAAGDVISDSTSSAKGFLTFPNITPNQNGGTIIQEAICIDFAAQSTKPDLELWLFNAAPTISQDNAVLNVANTDFLTANGVLKFVGIIQFPTSSFVVGKAATNCVCVARNLSMPVSSATTTGNPLYGILVVRNAYTPVALEQFTVLLKFAD